MQLTDKIPDPDDHMETLESVKQQSAKRFLTRIDPQLHELYKHPKGQSCILRVWIRTGNRTADTRARGAIDTVNRL